MGSKKPNYKNYKLYANYEKITLKEAALLINGILPENKYNEIFDRAMPQLDKGNDLSFLEEFKKPCVDYYHLNKNFWNIKSQAMAYGEERFEPLKIINKALDLGLCTTDNEFVIAVDEANPNIERAKARKTRFYKLWSALDHWSPLARTMLILGANPSGHLQKEGAIYSIIVQGISLEKSLQNHSLSDSQKWFEEMLTAEFKDTYTRMTLCKENANQPDPSEFVDINSGNYHVSHPYVLTREAYIRGLIAQDHELFHHVNDRIKRDTGKELFEAERNLINSDVNLPTSGAQQPPYLNEKHKNYAPELKIALDAWGALFGNPDAPQRRGVEVELCRYLRSQKITITDAAIKRICTVITPSKRKEGGVLAMSSSEK